MDRIIEAWDPRLIQTSIRQLRSDSKKGFERVQSSVTRARKSFQIGARLEGDVHDIERLFPDSYSLIVSLSKLQLEGLSNCLAHHRRRLESPKVCLNRRRLFELFEAVES